MRILGFDWDEVNRAKLAGHDLFPSDVEALFECGDPCFFPHSADRRRHLALGFTPDGRFVLVIFEHEPETRWVRVATAYEPSSERWWKAYARAAGIDA